MSVHKVGNTSVDLEEMEVQLELYCWSCNRDFHLHFDYMGKLIDGDQNSGSAFFQCPGCGSVQIGCYSVDLVP